MGIPDADGMLWIAKENLVKPVAEKKVIQTTKLMESKLSE